MAKKTQSVDAAATTVVDPKAKLPKHRSPNYPSMDLAEIVALLPKVFEKMKRHAVGVELAVGYMGFSFKSSTGKLALASMRAFGLFETIGEGAGATVKLSPRGLDIANDYPRDSAEWIAAVKKAALSPKVHEQLWEKYGASPPPDDELRRYLTRDLKFNDNSVAGFIDEYKTTIAFAKLSSEDIIEEDNGDDDDDLLLPPHSSSPVKVGAIVQWVSGGKDQFQQPRRVVGVSDDRKWVFVEGSKTGIPMDQTFVDRNHSGSVATDPPANPHYKPLGADGPRIEFPLPDGNAIEIRLKKRVAKKDFDRIKKLVDLSEDSLVEEDSGQSDL